MPRYTQPYGSRELWLDGQHIMNLTYPKTAVVLSPTQMDQIGRDICEALNALDVQRFIVAAEQP